MAARSFSGGFPVEGQLFDHGGLLKFHRDDGKVYDIVSTVPEASAPQEIGTWSILTNGDPDNPEIIFVDGEVVAIYVPTT